MVLKKTGAVNELNQTWAVHGTETDKCCPWFWNRPWLSMVLNQIGAVNGTETNLSCPCCWNRPELSTELKQTWAVHGAETDLSCLWSWNRPELTMVLNQTCTVHGTWAKLCCPSPRHWNSAEPSVALNHRWAVCSTETVMTNPNVSRHETRKGQVIKKIVTESSNKFYCGKKKHAVNFSQL